MEREVLISFLVDNAASWGDVTFSHTGSWVFQDNQYIHTIHDPITIDDWNRAKIVPNTKVRILSPKHSEYVQKLSFEAGFKWYCGGTEVQFIGAKHLVFWNTLRISHGHPDNEELKEIFIEMPELKNPKELLDETNDLLRKSGTDINARVLAEKVGSKHNAVHNPKHYEVIEGVEAIELIAASLTLEQWRGYCLGNIIKYRLRAGKKDDLQQDIDKANEYEMLYSKYADTCKEV